MSNKLNFQLTKERLSDLSTGQITVSALLGAGLGMAFVSMDDVSELEGSSSEMAESKNSEYLDAQVSLTGVSDHSVSDMSFGDIFSIERNLQGPGGVFSYNGKLYNTFHKEEWDQLSNVDKGDFLASYDLKHSVDTVSYKSNVTEISIDNDAQAEIVIGDVNSDGIMDVVEVDLNNDGHIDVIHSSSGVNVASSVNTQSSGDNFDTDVSFEVPNSSGDVDAEYEAPLTYTYEENLDSDSLDQLNDAMSDIVIDESALLNDVVKDAVGFEVGDMIDPSDVAIELETGDMLDPSDVAIELEAGDMVDPSDVAIELEAGDMVDPSDVDQDIVDDTFQDLNLNSGSTDLDAEDVTGLDLSEFDF